MGTFNKERAVVGTSSKDIVKIIYHEIMLHLHRLCDVAKLTELYTGLEPQF